jgi:hypothetical protein
MLEEEFEIITLIIKSWALVAHACKTLHKKKKKWGSGQLVEWLKEKVLGSNSSTAKKKEMLMRDRKKTVTPQLPS